MERTRAKKFVPRNFAAKRVVGNVLMRIGAWNRILSAMEGKADAKMEVMNRKKPAVLMYVINLDVGSAQGSPSVSTLGQCVMGRPIAEPEGMKVHIYVPRNFAKVNFWIVLMEDGNALMKPNA